MVLGTPEEDEFMNMAIGGSSISVVDTSNVWVTSESGGWTKRFYWSGSPDFTMVEDLLDLLGNLNKDYGITLIVIQHNLEILRPFCSRLIMLRGTIMYDGLPNIPRADELIKRVF